VPTAFEIPLRIAGDARAAADGRISERRRPDGSGVVTRAARATVEDVDRAVAAAASAFTGWSATGPSRRRELLLHAADALIARTPEFVGRVGAETGGTPGWATFNVTLAAGMFREAASLTTQIKGEVILSDKPGVFAMAVRKPAGVVVGIAPWNAPVILGVRAIATPLACGNTVVLKASEICPATHSLIVEVLESAGLPPGVVNLITNDPEDAPAIVERLVAHRDVRRVNFTGSTRVGRRIGELCGRHLKPALLELGGKAPLVVLDDADLDAAVNAVVFGAFMNQGQICMSTERAIVDDRVADAFVSRLAQRAADLTAGAEGHALGSLVGAGAVDHVAALLADAEVRGAHVVARPAVDGVFVSAGVVDAVTPAMRIYAEESFGPLGAVVRVTGDAQAVVAANDTEYGLSASVFSRDISRALRVAQGIHSGICHINGPTVADEPQMPFGGVKASGYGRFGGAAGVAEFTDLQWLTISTSPPHYPF
jgi:acyl-CoA reductase-like NAD-dependent aldehyde dehydrogenase